MEKLLFSVIFCIFISAIQYASSQQLSSGNDKVYLDTIQAEIEEDVKEAKTKLIENAKVVEAATTDYAAVKLTHNIFKALRVLAEKELEAIPMKNRIRQPRQEEAAEEEVSGGDDEELAATDTPSAAVAATTNRTETLIPVLAGILKSVFGGTNGTKPLNVTHTLQTAQKIIFRPFGRPFAGLNNLLDRIRPTAAPAPAQIKYYPVPVYPDPIRITRPPPTEPPTTTTPEPTTTRILRLVGREDSSRVKRYVEQLVREDVVTAAPVPVTTPSTTTTTTPVYEPVVVVPRTTTPSAPLYVAGPGYAPAYPAYPNYPATGPVLIQTKEPELVPVKPPTHAPRPVGSKPHPGLVISPNPEPASSGPIDVVGNVQYKPLKAAPVPVYAPSYVPVYKPQRTVVSSSQAVAEPVPIKPVEDVVKVTVTEAPVTVATTVASVTTEASTPVVVTEVVTTKSTDNETTVATSTAKLEPGLIYIDVLARDVQQGLDGIIKNLPDILKGVREGLSLLENIRDIFGEVDT